MLAIGVLAVAPDRQPGDPVSLTDIRGLGVNTTQQAKQIADFLVRQQLLQLVGEPVFEVRETVRQRFTLSAETSTLQVAPHVTPQVTPPLESGMLEMTIADKPQSSKHRYRLTAQGQAAVAKGDA